MKVIGAVAVNSFREAVRDRVLYVLVLFAVLLIGVSVLIGEITAGQDIKIVKDLGLAAISVFGLLIAVFIGIGLVWKEVERRSIYSLLAKPLRRHELVLGKYCGLALTLLITVALMTATFYAVLGVLGRTFPADVQAAWRAPAMDPALLKAVLLIFVELLLVTAVALFFSTFSSPMLSMAMTLAIWVIGTFGADLRDAGTFIDSPPTVLLMRTLYYALPNFSAFDVKAQVVHALPVGWPYIGTTIAYGAAYIALLLTGAAVVFQRREFK
jgi:Cu-processing system permease protein